ncbi:MAG: GAF domain-containing protein [Pseudomonadota bacterium]
MNREKGKILAVDSDESALASVSRMLGNKYEVETSSDGSEALRLLEALRSDILITDAGMVNRENDILSASLNFDPNLRVIVTDFAPSVETAIKVMKAGAFDYLFKPINAGSLLESLEKAMEDRRNRVDRKYLEDVFYEVKTSVASSLNLEKVLDSIVQGVSKAMKAKGSSLSLLDKSHKRLMLVGTHGLSRNYISKGPIDASKSIGETILKGEVVWVKNAADDPRTQYPEDAAKEGIRSILSIPLKVPGKVIGALRVYSSEERDCLPEELRVLKEFSDQAAMAIQNARLYEDVKNEYDNLREDLRMYFDEIGWD